MNFELGQWVYNFDLKSWRSQGILNLVRGFVIFDIKSGNFDIYPNNCVFYLWLRHSSENC